MKKTKRIFSAALLVLFLFSFLVPVYRAQAIFGGGPSIPSPTSAMNQIFTDLGVDKPELKNTIATSNTSRQKKQAPQVSISFSPENPTPGELVTATAQPAYFLNDPQDLYFTWYLKRDSCPLGSASGHPNCDLNGDGDIDIEDYKITAARKIASAEFDWDRNGDAVPDPDIYKVANHTDDDGYYPPNPDDPGTDIDAPFGGNDQIDKPDHCYLHDFETGNEYEIGCSHLFPRGVPGTVGDGQFTLAEEEFWHTDPANNDTAGTTRSDEANVVGLGIFEFSWAYQEGDLVGVAIEGSSVEATQYKDASFKTMWALSKNRCDIGSSIDEGNAENGTTTVTTPETTTVTASLVVPNPTCTSFTYSDFGVCQPNDLQYRTVTSASPAGCIEGGPSLTQPCVYGGGGACTSFTYTPYGACQPNGTRSREVATFDPAGCIPAGLVLTESCTYTPPTPPLLSASATSITVDNGSGSGIPIADWPEAGFLKIDDEIIGYSARTSTGFTGLARGADGTTAATHADGAEITGNTTIVETEVTTQVTVNSFDLTATTLVTTAVTTTVQDVRGTNVSGPETIITEEENTANNGSYDLAINDLNDCLYENMLPPSGGNEDDKLKIDLSYSPQTPMGEGGLSADQLADPLYAENTDTLIVNASVANSENADFLRYDWVVYGANSSDPITWTPIGKSQLTDSTQMGGIGVKSLKFKLKFGMALPQYLKVKVTASENRSGTVNSGRASAVIPVTSMNNRLLAYSSRVDASDLLALAASPRCENLLSEPFNSRTICPVAQNEIVGMRVNNSASLENFLWTVNGQPVNYTECFFQGCLANEQTDTMFFPVLKDPGTQYTVNLVATNTDSGEKINVTRIFEVVTPTVKIVSADDDSSGNGAKPVVLGEYINTADAALPRYPDKSELSFMALQGTDVRLCPIFNVPFVDADKTTWILDGQEIDSSTPTPVSGTSSCTNGLVFGATKDIDLSYTVGINAIYRQDPAIRRMLSTYWDVQVNNFYETQINDTIDIVVAGSLEGLTLSSAKIEPGPKKLLASLASNAPSYLNFLFRIVITTFLLLYFIKIIFSLSPITDEG